MAATGPEALARLNRALGELIVDGVDTTIPLFHALLQEEDIQTGNYNIHWLEHWLEDPSRADLDPPVDARMTDLHPDPGASAARPMPVGIFPDGRKPRRPRRSSGSIRAGAGSCRWTGSTSRAHWRAGCVGAGIR